MYFFTLAKQRNLQLKWCIRSAGTSFGAGLPNYYITARKSGKISSHTEKLFSTNTRQSMKRQIATERLSKICYIQMRIHMGS